MPFKHLAILQHRHCELHLNGDGLLHKEGGAAVLYRDGFGVWALNGTRVPQWLAEQRGEVINPSRIAELDNAQVRREFVAKVGIERIERTLQSRVLEHRRVLYGGEHREYTLLDIAIPNVGSWRYLKMENASVPEIWHLEGVPIECATVNAALNFRNGLDEQDIDEEHGAEWEQQGDVILRPIGAGKYKRFPRSMT